MIVVTVVFVAALAAVGAAGFAAGYATGRTRAYHRRRSLDIDLTAFAGRKRPR